MNAESTAVVNEVEAVEAVETKAAKAPKAPKTPKAPKEPKVELPPPVLPQARRGIDFPESMNVSQGELSGYNTFWTIEGRKGIYSYVGGCKATQEPSEGQIVAWVKDGQAATFVRNTNFDYFVKTVLG